MSQMNLPAYRFPTRNALLDLSGINNAIDGYQNAERYAEAETYKRGQDQQNMLMRKAALADSRAARQFSQDRQTRNFERQQADSDRNYALRERQVSAAEAARQSAIEEEKARQRAHIAGRMVEMAYKTDDPLERQKALERILSTDKSLAARLEATPYRSDPNAALGYISALAYAKGYRPQAALGGGVKYGLNPIYGRDAEGNVVLLQPGNDGSAVQTAVPDGVTVDPSLQSQQRAYGSAVGKLQGEATADIPTVEARAKTVTDQIDALLNDPYLSSMTGGSNYFPTVTGRGQATQARIDQLRGQAFLQAFQELKGAGQITEAEGQRAEAAKTRLVNQYQSDDEYRAALEEFRREVESLVDLAKRKAGVPASAQGGGGRGFRVIGRSP